MGSKMELAVSEKLKGPSAPRPFPILELNPELVILICEFLSPVDRCSLSLSCKRFFKIFTAHKQSLPKPHSEDRFSFFETLERDLGDKYYFCRRCIRLHRFDKSWTPKRANQSQIYGCLLNKYFPFCLFSGPYLLGEHHVRLVMNNHFYGAQAGIPLKSLEGTRWVHTPACKFYTNPNGTWHQQWTARIIQDELFLRAQHTLLARDARQLEHALNSCCYHICRHTSMHWRSRESVVYPGPAYEYVWHNSRQPPLLTDYRRPFMTARNKLGSCVDCLTDWLITIETADSALPLAAAQRTVNTGGREYSGWRVAVTTVHRVGSGRSPWDPKWLAFTSSTPCNLYPRKFQQYPSGVILKAWNAAEQASRGPLNMDGKRADLEAESMLVGEIADMSVSTAGGGSSSNDHQLLK